MKNREYKTLAAMALVMSLTAGLFYTAPAALYAKENTGKSESSAYYKKVNAAAKTTDVKPLKDETVYAKIDGSGTVMSVTVSDQLKNIKDLDQIKDISALKKIENLKGDEEFSKNDNVLTWSGDNKDICYQGTTKQPLPVSVKISYKLDGKDITADELNGKSGHLIMKYQYENTTGNKNEEFTPFLMVTGLILDSDKFTNVQVNNGKLLSDGDRNIVLGMGLPKMKEHLNIKDLDIPDSFELEADITNYEAAEGITIAANDVFNNLDTKKLNSLSDLKGSMKRLQDSSNQLVGGSGELQKGLDTLLFSSGALPDGIEKLSSGSSTLKAGTEILYEGSSTLANGSSTLADGTGLLLTGTGELHSGTDELDNGLKLVSGKVSGELLPGAKALDNGVLKMQKSLSSQLPGLCEGISSLSTGVNQAADGAAALDAGIGKAAAGAFALSDGMDTAAAGITGLNQGLQNAAQTASVLSNDAQQLKEAVSTSNAPAYTTDTTDSLDEISQLQSLKETLSTCGDLPDGTLESLDGIISNLTEEQNQRSALQTASSSDNGLLRLAEKVSGEALGLQTAFNGSEGNPGLSAAAASLDTAFNYGNPDAKIPSLTYAANALNAALNTGDPSNGTPSILSGAAALDGALNRGNQSNNVPSIKDGLNTLNEGINGKDGLSSQVNEGISQLKTGTSQVLNGIDNSDGLANGLEQLAFGASKINSAAGTLNDKMSEANNGAKSLSAGAGALSLGAGELNSGAQTLDTGIHTLKNGSGALIDGVEQLDTGAKALNEGMLQFDEEGIRKLVKAFDGDISGLPDKLHQMIDASKKYKNFTGIADGMDGDVKFIFVSNK